MRTPIAQALAFPDRIDCRRAAARPGASLPALSFEAPDLARFPCLGAGLRRARRRRHRAGDAQCRQRSGGGGVPGRRIRFTDIAAACAATLARLPARPLVARRCAGRRCRGARVRLRHWLKLAASKMRYSAGMIDFAYKVARLPRHARRAGRVPRARPLRRRALVRRQGAALFRRLRPRHRGAPVRPRRHGVGAVGDSAGRLREDGRRARRRRRAGRRRARVQSPERLEAHRDRRGRAPSPTCCSPSCCSPARTWPAFRASARCSPSPRRGRRPPRRAFAAGDLVVALDGEPCRAGRTCAGACCKAQGRDSVALAVMPRDARRRRSAGDARAADRRRASPPTGRATRSACSACAPTSGRR